MAERAQPPPARTSPLLRALQALALTAVAGLFALLVWRVLDAGRGAHLVNEVRAGKKPQAPQFTLPVLWGGQRRGRTMRAVPSATGSCRSASCGATRS